MVKKLKQVGRSIAAYLKTPEIVYSLGLIVLIPGLIVLNSIVLTNLFAGLVDTQAKDKAAVTAQLLKRSLTGPDSAVIQSRIDEIVEGTTDVNKEKYFLRLDYLIKRPGEEAFELVASSSKDEIGKVIRPQADSSADSLDDPRSFTQLNLSWAERRDIAVSAVEQTKPGYVISVLGDDPRSQERQAVVSAFVSTQYIDQLLTDSYFRSASLLTITVVITLVLLFLRSRIYRYTTLFKRLQEVDQMKDEFITVASHELRTPITAIRGYLTVLLETHDLSDAEQHKMIESAERSSRQLNALVADLLDVSRIEQGRVQLEPAKINIDEAIAKAADQLKGLAAEKKIDVNLVPAEQKLFTRADARKLHQILINFMDNAIKYTEKGSITISASEEGDSVAVFIRDTGIGMSPEDRQNLFKKFYRVQNKETEHITGTGLGLWITKSLIELMGGSVFVDSIKGSGTQIKFTLPKA